MKILVIAERMPSRLGGGSIRQFNLIRALTDKRNSSLSSASSRLEGDRGVGSQLKGIENNSISFTVVAHAFPEDLLYRLDLEALVEDLILIPLQVPGTHPATSRVTKVFNAWKHALLETWPQRGHFSQTDAMRQAIQEMLSQGDFDLVQVHQTYLMPLLPNNTPLIVLDMHDIISEFEHDLIKQKTKATHRLQAWLEWKKMLALERKAVLRASICTVTSEVDRQKLLALHPQARVEVIANGVDLEYFSANALPQPVPAQVENSLVFTGSMNYPPNAEAVIWFEREIFPLLSDQPRLSWKIVGWGPPPEIQALHRPPTIQVTGFVEDVRLFLAESQVVVVPLLSGSGTRLKILEAWAMGKAVVSTSLGAEGLPAVHRENMLLADQPRDFADAVAELLGDPAKRVRLGQAGRQTVEAHFSWQAIGRDLARTYQRARQSRT